MVCTPLRKQRAFNTQLREHFLGLLILVSRPLIFRRSALKRAKPALKRAQPPKTALKKEKGFKRVEAQALKCPKPALNRWSGWAVLFNTNAFLSLFLAPLPVIRIQERKRHININKFFRWLPGWGGWSPDRVARGLPTGGQGSKVYVLCAEPKEHKHFRPGYPAGRIGYPARRIGWPGWPRNCLCSKCLCAFSGP